MPLYWGVGFANTVLGGAQNWVALYLMASIVSSMGACLNLLFSPAVAVLSCGLQMAVWSLFAGVLVQVGRAGRRQGCPPASRGHRRRRLGCCLICMSPPQLPDLFVIWRPWAAYIDPCE